MFLLLTIILIVIGVLIYNRCTVQSNRENLKVLKNPAHLAPTVFRVSNTILTAGGQFSDELDKYPLPDSVRDNFNEWVEKGYVSSVKDQMLCGGCWAFATCSSLADRLTIATAGKWRAPFGLSEQILISCGGQNGMDFYQGCDGGIPQFAIESLVSTGVPADEECAECGGGSEHTSGSGSGAGGVVNPNTGSTCQSGGNVYASTDYTYFQTGCEGSSSCSITAAGTCPCTAVTKQMEQVDDKKNPFNVKYKTVGSAHVYTSHGVNNELHTVDLWPDIPDSVIAQNVERMKKAIYYEGPITIGYRVTQDFYNYWPTVAADNYYKYDGRSPMAGGHAVVIVGWKKMDDGTPVWIMKNSWGENGGYGFDKPLGKNPVTGEKEQLYKGGFWNHVMGENDSFVESNASGAHPYLHDSPIVDFLPGRGSAIPKNWYETMTLRQIHDMVAKDTAPEPEPDMPPQPVPGPQPEPPIPKPQPIEMPDITNDTFNTMVLTPGNITPQSIEKFFAEPGNLYMVGANSADVIEKVLTLLPNKANLTQDNVEELIQKISESVTGYLVVAAKGAINNYYYMHGDPGQWNIFTKNYASRSASVDKFVYDVYSKFESLSEFSPIVQVTQKSTEKFSYRFIV